MNHIDAERNGLENDEGQPSIETAAVKTASGPTKRTLNKNRRFRRRLGVGRLENHIASKVWSQPKTPVSRPQVFVDILAVFGEVLALPAPMLTTDTFDVITSAGFLDRNSTRWASPRTLVDIACPGCSLSSQ
jgi:hypothetical protein